MKIDTGISGILIAVYMASAVIISADGASVRFQGQSMKVIEEEAPKNTGLDRIFVAYDTEELTEMRIEGASADLEVSRYSTLGGGYAEPVQFHWEGNTAIIDNPQGEMGYILTENGRNTCIWLVNYAIQRFSISSVALDDTQDCSYTNLDVEGTGPAIHYFTIDGRRATLSRDIEVSHDTWIWDDTATDFVTEHTVKNLEYLTNPVTLTTPLYCSTVVTVSGDRFLAEWGMEQKATSMTLSPNGIDAHTNAVQTNLPDESDDSDPSNIVNGSSGEGGLGGSAPATIVFTAYVTEAVIHDEWQMSADPEFQNIDYRWNEREVEYTFEEEGTYYVRYIGSNADGTCEVYGETYTISIGASDLRIPNAFTPNGDGVNDVWKVAYRSLLDFNCTIFDRYGNKIYHFSDPNQGWDGKYKGKTVGPGVYYYVIEAKGSDGKKYKKGGDINVVGYKNRNAQTTPAN